MHKRSFIFLGAVLFGCGASEAPASPPPVAQIAPRSTAEPQPSPRAMTTRRIVVQLGRNTGTDVATTAIDGTITVMLDVLENGRGPHTDATIRIAPDGTIASLEAHGHHNMGTPVAESFVRSGDHAQWKSLEESGAHDITGSAFFLPMAELPDALGLLARALLRSRAPMALLPGGEARIEKDGELTVEPPSGGNPLHIVGYSITGLDLTPTHVWMNLDGTWFGYFSPWWSVVPEPWAGVVDAVLKKQDELDRARDARIASQHAHKPPPEGIAYTHARVLDVDHGKWIVDQTVLVVGDTIKSVGASKSAKIPANAEVVDLAGKAILPGLWDMHSHLSDSDGVLDIASGVTTARDVGNDPDKLDGYKERFDDGSAVGPHVIRFGFIEGRGEKAASSKVTAENETEAKAAVEFFAKRHYEGIKIYNSMKPELVPLLAKEAHARGMMVTGHIPVHMLANEAVRAGYDGIEHINMLFLNFLADHDTDTRTTTRFTLVGDKGADLDLKSKPVVDFFALLKQHHTVIDPTIDAFEGLLLGEQGKILPGLEPMVDRLPAQTQRYFLQGGLPLDAEKKARYGASFEKLLAMVKALHDAKITLVAGTDDLAGLMLHHELALFVRAGISPADTLKMATLEPARAMKLDKKTGSIAPGKTADLFVVDGDPLAHIEDVRHVVSTMRAGVVFMSAPLYQTVGVKP